MGLIKKISEALKKTRDAFRKKIDELLSHGELNEDFYDDLTDILISSDIGVSTSAETVEELRQIVHKNKIRKADEVKIELKKLLNNILQSIEKPKVEFPLVITLIGVNGVGKTTTIGKLAHFYKEQNKSICLVAGDTFRAAASSQLTEWANRNKVRIIKHEEGADAAAVVYDGLESAKAKNTDVTLVDTAGRLHTKTNLMEELSKIGRILEKQNCFCEKNYIIVDATAGQNAINMVRIFNNYLRIDGIILTKLDGTAKGGVVFAIAKELSLPVVFIGTGEKLEDIAEFNAKEFVDNIL